MFENVSNISDCTSRFEAAEEKQRQRVLESRAAAFAGEETSYGSKGKTTTATAHCGGGAGGARERVAAVGESKRGRKVNCGVFLWRIYRVFHELCDI